MKLRRQAAFGATAEAGRGQRPDPFALPVSFSVPPCGRSPGAATTATIDRGRISLTRASGLSTLPISDYRGVAVRMEAVSGGALSVILELNHVEPDLSVTLAIADDPADIASDWQAWGRALRLPIFVIEADGRLSAPMKVPGAIAKSTPKPRRMHSYFASRRPRFLARRKTGWRRDIDRFDGNEIIAPD